MEQKCVSKQALQRMPLYLAYLKSLGDGMPATISATVIAEALGLGDVQVRKDLAALEITGRPKVGYITKELILALERYLGYDELNNSIIVGAGRLGRALMSYEGFTEYGLHILAAFDTDPKICGSYEGDKPILPMDKLCDLCRRWGVRIGIITVPAAAAQGVCSLLVEAGVRAIWNFAPVHLTVPDDILVQSVNMASSLALLSNHLSDKIYK